ncbi:hypothetical protein PEBR_23717 [Penicillium brasilianum]|uniref:Uncharacterized protein n=1 Tax=Penicillium brasilianum TaxID=104259 RepID=A0A1S9RLA4_PENBI|nr:hypothetical protein PEBR_23717 [Penicillium brasilianum]
MRPETLESQALIPVISPDDAHQELVAISMKLLMGKSHKDINEFDEWIVAIESQSFLNYAASNWFLHNRDIQRITDGLRVQEYNGGWGLTTVYTKYGHEDIVTYLLSREADPNSVNRDGANAIDLAARRNHLEIVHILVQAGANVYVTEEEKNDPIPSGKTAHREDAIRSTRDGRLLS